MSSLHTSLLPDNELYDVIVDVVGDETSLEFCALTDHYLNECNLDTAARAHGTDWQTISVLAETVEKQAKTIRETQ